jgi:hypothetical protein
LRRQWTQQQEDAWGILNELDQVLDLLQSRDLIEDPEVVLILERNGRNASVPLPGLPCSPSEAL